jgi:glutaminyl-tRNA synthetase
LEFEDHRPLYDWVGYNLGFAPKPRQIEFARLAVTNTVMSKRYLKKLVEEGHVHGWDDPRMPTVAGLRNRGVPPEALLDFCTKIGIVKANSECQLSYLESCIRDNLNENAERAMAVLEPLKVTITNYEGEEELETALHPLKPELGVRKLAFSSVVYIDKADFSANPPPKYQRLKPDGYVRLKNAYIIHCDEVITDEKGEVVELKCTYVPESRSSQDTSGLKVKGTIQWVDGKTGVDAEIRRYGVLLKDAEYAGQDFGERMNLDSEHIFYGKAEPYLADSEENKPFQLMRVGYYKKCTEEGKLVLSEIVSLKDNFNK